MSLSFHAPLSAVQVRIARPTDKLDEIARFYCDGLGLQKIAEFRSHAGYDGIMIGLPNATYHLEFTQHEQGSPGAAPSKDNLLVFYIPDKNALTQLVQRLNGMGYPSVPSENPYWDTNSAITIEDPDGWRIVLMPTAGL